MAPDVQCRCHSMILPQLPKQGKASYRDRLFVVMFHVRLQLVNHDFNVELITYASEARFPDMIAQN